MTAAKLEQEDAQDNLCITFEGSIDVSMVVSLKKRLDEALTSAGTIELVVDDISRCDGAGVQLLAAFVVEAQQRNKAVKWLGTSDVLDDSVRLLGLETVFAAAVSGTAEETGS